MIKIAQIVTDIVRSSEFAITGIQNDCLNYASYARHIQDEVQKRAKKEVTVASIQIALSRLATKIRKEDPITPKIILKNISTSSSLFEATYTANIDTKRAVAKLQTDEDILQSSFLSIGMGLSEVNICTVKDLMPKVLEGFKPEEPVSFIDDLAALRLHVHEHTFYTPNVLHALLKEFATSGVNVINMLSGFTEITFIVNDSDMKKLFLLVHDNFVLKSD